MKAGLKVSLFLWLASSLPSAGAVRSIGVLVLAHGGTNTWNRTVKDLKKDLHDYPVEIAFGMADPREIQRNIAKLEGRRVEKIVVIPLFVSSHSEVMEQTRYLLGIRKDPSQSFLQAPHIHISPSSLKRIRTRLPLVLTPALDEHPLVAKILTDRARALSHEPAQESLVLVAHGPVGDKDNELWLKAMEAVGRKIQASMKFQSVHAVTLRDDAPLPVKEKAGKELRGLVRALSLHSRVLVVPDLISRGGIESHIRKVLEGAFYRWNGDTLMPDPLIAQWIRNMAETGAQTPDMRLYRTP